MTYRVVSVDSGSSCLKMYDGTRRVWQPAVVKELPAAERHTYRDEVLVEGRRYVVGPTARIAHKGKDDPFLERGYHGSVEQYVQICHGLEQLGAHGEYDVIYHSLPYTEHQDDAYRRRIKERLVFQWQADGKERTVRFHAAATMPQGVGALRLWQDKTRERDRPAMVALVDLGSCTADFVTVELDERTGDYQYCAGKSISLRAAKPGDPLINCKRFYDEWLKQITNIDGAQAVAWGYHELMLLPVKRQFLVRCGPGALVDLEPSFQVIADRFTHEVERTIREVLADVWPKVDKIILTGGGAELCNLGDFHDSRVERLSVWANAEGQYLSAQRAGSQRKEVIDAASEHEAASISCHI